METLTRDEVRAKIAKLMALSTSPNENEAASALAKAQELMMKYSLSQAEITINVEEKLDDFVRNLSIAIVDTEWQDVFINLLSKVFDCYIYKHRTAKNKQTYIIKCYGNSFDIEIMMKLYHRMLAVISQLADAEMIQAKLDGRIGKNRTETMAYKRCWFQGCVTRLCQRLIAQKQMQMAENNACRALVIKKEEFNRAMLKEDSIKVSAPPKRKRTYDVEAYHRGVSAGDGICINQQIQ